MSWHGTLETDTVELPLLWRSRKRSRHRVPVLTILCHPQAGRVGEQACLHQLTLAQGVRVSRLEPGFAQPWEAEDDAQPLADPYLSRRPFGLAMQGVGRVELDCGGSGIPVRADGKLVETSRGFTVEELERGVVLELANRVVVLLHFGQVGGVVHDRAHGLVGASDPMRWLHEEIRRVADLEVPVLIRGETGTGKELVARAIHRSSPRADREMLSVNMGAIPTSLAAAELFGSIRGAFTGAEVSRGGYFGRGQGSTLFLDEVGETPPEVQAMLLRVLETGEAQAVGSDRPRRVDVRLIAATDADLEQAIDACRFRAPLLHRLAGYEIRVPSLGERRPDFGRLLYTFLRQEMEEVGEAHRLQAADPTEEPWIAAPLVARLARREWPGNVRQLRNVARQMVIASRGRDRVTLNPSVERLLEETSPLRLELPPEAVKAAPKPAYRDPSEVGDEELITALRANRWRLKPAAVALGVSRTSLYALIERCPRVRKAADLSCEEIEGARDRCGSDLDALAEELEVSKYGLRQRITSLGLG